MSDKRQEVGKTEEQLKQEARIRREYEAKLAAAKPKSEATIKRENFWYHYKWHTIIGVAVLMLTAFFVKDSLFSTKPDVTIVMIAGKYFSPESVELMQEEIERVAGDFNSDKKTFVIVDFIMLPSNSEEVAGLGQQDYVSNMKLSAVLASAVDPVYLLDEAAYRFIVNMGGQDGDEPETDNVFRAESVSAGVFGQPEFSDMRFYLRRDCKNEEYYRYCEELLKTIRG